VRYMRVVLILARKTGIEVPDTGVRDEHGLETLDHLFSSPEKPARSPAKEAAFKTNGFSRNVDATLSSESDMEMGESMSWTFAIPIAYVRQTSTQLTMSRHHSRADSCSYREKEVCDSDASA
jgi:centromere protein C